ncbi:4-azaleucine resistance transporter AzlC [Salsuginibacillus halophilus]|uniref:4-azaleucine resistance transporter AzlC n=1 Tax=Salsuginibacillus halophilus TaxID=517424 RepID=A0A2P8HXK4_9BACI|nr:AzlC family ABC transporter permease [Salsuginibacillus halophilus]PSL50948.1 4-azaleucine resistance transporter AzlC [Salsuginibacillus halophilus]
MQTTTLSSTPSPFLRGLTDGLPLAVGYAPAAITFGFLAASTHLTMVEAVLMSMLVFAGAAQYMALNLIALSTGVLEIILTTFVVNIRHLLMSISLNEKAEKDHPLKKAGYAFGITDEVFTVTSTKEAPVPTGYITGVFLMAYMSWVVNTALGHVGGALLPEVLQQSMVIALYALFLALLAPAMRSSRKVISLAVLAAGLNAAFGLVIAEGWAIIAATLTASVIVEMIVPLEQSDNRKESEP